MNRRHTVLNIENRKFSNNIISALCTVEQNRMAEFYYGLLFYDRIRLEEDTPPWINRKGVKYIKRERTKESSSKFNKVQNINNNYDDDDDDNNNCEKGSSLFIIGRIK